jgi:hypothetical protein
MRQFLCVSASLAVLLAPGGAFAGQYKTLDASQLEPGQELIVRSSPQNSGGAMEIDVYEWQGSADDPDALYLCRVFANKTGQTLNLSMIDIDALDIISSCSAPLSADEGCLTLFQVHPETDIKLLCIVGTGIGFPVCEGAHYKFSILRSDPTR